MKNSDGSVSVAYNIESQAPCGARLEGGDPPLKTNPKAYKRPNKKANPRN